MDLTARKIIFEGHRIFRTVLRPHLRQVPGARVFARTLRTIASPGFRSELRLQRDRPDNLFQPFRHTAANRYPGIFRFVQLQLAEVKRPRILSFGCSTGQEVFTLREYFPDAMLTGIDINPRNIRVCQRRGRKASDLYMRFRHAANTDQEEPESYDAIFCMAVFRHGGLSDGEASTCEHLIRFSDFERTLSGIDRCLKPGGYICVIHSNFRFCDTNLANRYAEVLHLQREQQLCGVPLYGRDNRRMAEVVYNAVVFQKHRSHQDAIPSGMV